MRIIDLRSDTVTQPTAEMRRAIAEAELGDDVYEEDPTVNRLEAMAAERLGKEAALLVVSGTMANLVSALTHCQRGDEMIVGSEAHIFHNEVGGVSALGGVHVRMVPNDSLGMMAPEEVEAAIRLSGIQQPRTALVCLENTHNRCGGAVLDPEDVAAIAQVAHRHGVAVHVDGARIFNAAVALEVSAAELAWAADSVSFCLSKGLSCPVGSLICGSREFIARARKYRKMVGGGMRQAGIIAAAGIVALNTMVERLAEDHANAKLLAYGLAKLPGIYLEPGLVRTNIVVLEVQHRPAQEFLDSLKTRGLLASYLGGRKVRMVTHYGIIPGDIAEALNVVDAVAAG